MLLRTRNAYSGPIHTLMILLLMLLGIGLLLGGCERSLPEGGRQLSALPLDKDVRVTYSLMLPVEWQRIDRLELSVESMVVSFIVTEHGRNLVGLEDCNKKGILVWAAGLESLSNKILITMDYSFYINASRIISGSN